jgi:ribosomal protein S27AE
MLQQDISPNPQLNTKARSFWLQMELFDVDAPIVLVAETPRQLPQRCPLCCAILAHDGEREECPNCGMTMEW